MPGIHDGVQPNVAMITAKDLAGERWNGFELMTGLRRRGVPSVMFTYRKLSQDPDVVEIGGFRGRDTLTHWLTRIEEAASLQSVLYPWGEWIVRHPRFRSVNLVHLHIFHLEFMGLWSLSRLARGRKLLVTLHDAWPLTGHCVHPRGCERLMSGCGECPDLGLPFPMRRDRTAAMIRRKRAAYRDAGAHLHVTSDYMLGLARSAPASEGLHCTKIPLGVDTSQFRPSASAEERAQSRRRLGIGPERFVVGLRATFDLWKGLPTTLEALRSLAGRIPLTVITFQERGALSGLPETIQVQDLGWTTPPSLPEAYRCMDLFLMPSLQEAFGFMALEAMACGVPVVGCAGTAVEEVLGGESCGYLLSERSASALAAAVLQAHADPDERLRKSTSARSRALAIFDRNRYEDAMLQLYRSLLDG